MVRALGPTSVPVGAVNGRSGQRRLEGLERRGVGPVEQDAVQLGHLLFDAIEAAAVGPQLLHAEETGTEQGEQDAADAAGDQVRQLLGDDRLVGDAEVAHHHEDDAGAVEGPAGVRAERVGQRFPEQRSVVVGRTVVGGHGRLPERRAGRMKRGPMHIARAMNVNAR